MQGSCSKFIRKVPLNRVKNLKIQSFSHISGHSEEHLIHEKWSILFEKQVVDLVVASEAFRSFYLTKTF